MRVPPIARNALFLVGMGLLTANYVHAAAAVVTPAAGQAVQTINGVRVASGIVRGGYVLGQASLYIAEFGGAVTMQVGSRIAAGAVVAAAAAVPLGALVVGGVALGIAAGAASDWLSDAHAAGKAQDFEYNPTTQTIDRKASAAGSGWEANIQIPAGQDGAGQSIGAYTSTGCGAWISCPVTYHVTRPYNCELGGREGANALIQVMDKFGTGRASFCVGQSTATPPLTPGGTPTAADWERLAADLAAIPVNPKILEQMGKPIPVDPVPVINPPNQSGASDVDVGSTNPAPALVGQPMTVTGQAVPVAGTSPQQYTQPVWTVTPANDAANPYGVNVVVNNITTGNPATPTNPSTPIPGTATPATPDVCAQNPNAAMCQPVGTITDPSMPPIPELYVRKYPDGITGIWQAKSEAIKQASLFTLAAQLMPTNVVAGTCPSWQLSLNLGPSWAQLGTHEIAPPCWIWDVCKAIIIVSALMLARRLIFGG